MKKGTHKWHIVVLLAALLALLRARAPDLPRDEPPLGVLPVVVPKR